MSDCNIMDERITEPVKFRLWDGHKMQEVGDITFHTDGSYHVNGEYPVNDAHAEKMTGRKVPYRLLRGTGIKDMHGKDICEGDILRVGDEKALYDVKWRCGAFFIERKLHPDLGDNDRGWRFCIMCDSDQFDGDETMKDTAIVGNVQENPDLLLV